MARESEALPSSAVVDRRSEILFALGAASVAVLLLAAVVLIVTRSDDPVDEPAAPAAFETVAPSAEVAPEPAADGAEPTAAADPTEAPEPTEAADPTEVPQPTEVPAPTEAPEPTGVEEPTTDPQPAVPTPTPLVVLAGSSENSSDIVAELSALFGTENLQNATSGGTDAPVVVGIVLRGPEVFSDGATTLAPGILPTLDRIRSFMLERPGSTINVVGHTSGLGDAGENLTLSVRRAEVVGQYLVDTGLPVDRVGVFGRGESDPIASNDTDEGRAANDRIQITIENLQAAP